MAVVEISRIQVRRGQENQTGVPTLAGGEFGWAADTEHLYIGLRRDDGGARDANVRVLTENDLFQVVTTTDLSYTYRSETDPSITAATLPGLPFERPISKKADDIVSIKDFGVEGIGGDEVASDLIQVAVDNLFLDPLKITSNYGKSPSKILYFPAGIYNIDTTIFIPRYTTIMGEGPDKTIFNLISNASHALQTIDSDPDNINESGRTTFDNLEFGGINTGISQPNEVHIEGMTIRYDSSLTNLTETLSLISLDCSENSVIKNVKFMGNRPQGNTSTTSTYVGIDLRGYDGMLASSQNVLVDECEFNGLKNCIQSNYDVLFATVQNSRFYNSIHGVAFNDPQSDQSDAGPKYARINNNLFNGIEAEAIYVGSSTEPSSYHVSSNNKFYNVGNQGIDEDWGNTPVITYKTDNNSSFNDYFNRHEYWQTVNLDSNTHNYYPLVDGYAALQTPVVQHITLPSDGTVTKVVVLPTSTQGQQLTVRYNMFAGGYDLVTKLPSLSVDRMGVLTVTLQNGNIMDNYSYNANNGSLIWTISYDAQYGRYVLYAAFTGSSSVTLETQTTIMI